MTVYEPDAQAYALLSLQDGAWTEVPQVDGGQIEVAAVSADGASGWAVGRASAGAPLSIYALGNSKWTAGGSIDGAAEATDLAADNTGNAWALVDGARVIRIHSGGAWEAAYTAESDVTLSALAVDSLERGWAGWLEGQRPGNPARQHSVSTLAGAGQALGRHRNRSGPAKHAFSSHRSRASTQLPSHPTVARPGRERATRTASVR